VCAELAAGRGQPRHGFKERVGHDGFEGVQLQLAGLDGHGHCRVRTDDAERDLVDHFRDDGVYLAGHDGGSGLAGREDDFAWVDSYVIVLS